MKTAEEIVRAMAGVPRTRDDHGILLDEGVCAICLADPCEEWCPHRQAVEWVAGREGEKPTACTRCKRVGTVAESLAANWNCQAEGCGGQMVRVRP